MRSNIPVTFFVPSMNCGGVEKVFINLMNEFASLNYNVTLLLCYNEGVLLSLLDKRIKLISFNKQLRKSLFPLILYFRKANPKVVISGPHYANVVAVLACILSFRKTKVIVTHHNFHDEETKLLGLHGRLAPYILKFFYSRAFKVVAVSKSLKNHLLKDLKINSFKVEMIYNPVSTNTIYEFSRLPISHKFFPEKRDFKIVIAIGRLSPVKNYLLLIESFSEVRKYEKVRLVIIGDGPEENNLKTFIIDNKLEDQVAFIKSTSNPYNYLLQSDLLVLPSNSESFSLVIVEALSLGINVLSTNTDGPMEILENGKYGYIVEKHNISEMNKGIIYALNHPFPKEHLVTRANDFRTENIAKKYIHLFEN